MIDFLIVGSGLFGSVFAREVTDKGYSCLIIDKRNHPGGNVYTEKIEGINVHKYGAHIFHTNDEKVWGYVNRFAKFNDYRHKVFVNHENRIFSFPINLMTLHQLWGITKPIEVNSKFNKFGGIMSDKCDNLEDWILSQVGQELYEIFIKGYTQKQWGRNPKDLPSSIIKRIPIRNNFNDFYFDDKYQGIPIGGYTQMINNITKGIEIKLSTNYFEDRTYFDSIASKIVFTGPIDEFYNYKFGKLEYRSINFDHELLSSKDYQGTSVMNYTDKNVPFTRILEHKHFEFGNQDKTLITREYPVEWKTGVEPYYPINDYKNNKLYNLYKQQSILHPSIIFGGRLGEYKYYDMHQIIASALKRSRDIK